MNYTIRDRCRLCASGRMTEVLRLAPTPLANEFLNPATPAAHSDVFPLYLVQCAECGHVQLPVIVDPGRLFSNYVYVSGTSPSFIDHFRRYAQEAIASYALKPGDLVVDIGSNDGTLLRFFKDAGMRVLGVDPAEAIAAQATANGIETLPHFFGPDLAAKILQSHGPATLVLANNMFAHADDLRSIAQGISKLLDPTRGRFVFEVQYLVDMVENSLFDMVYHEHLSYHGIAPLLPFFRSMNMQVIDVQRVATHGGSVRVCVAPANMAVQQASVMALVASEQAAMAGLPFEGLKARIDTAHQQIAAFFEEARQAGWRVAGFGAPAKLTTLMYQFGIGGKDIAYVVDDSPWKQGLLTPGTQIPVVPAAQLQSDPPDRILIFAWNFAEQIAAKHPKFAGRFVVPLPEFRFL